MMLILVKSFSYIPILTTVKMVWNTLHAELVRIISYIEVHTSHEFLLYCNSNDNT